MCCVLEQHPLDAKAHARTVFDCGEPLLNDFLHRYPCFRMGRLARSLDTRGTGMGEVLMGLAVDRCLKAKAHVGAYALLVNAKHEQAKVFYERYGFMSSVDAPLTLYLPVGR
jgi:predicted GNAT family N-acyltransferase